MDYHQLTALSSSTWEDLRRAASETQNKKKSFFSSLCSAHKSWFDNDIPSVEKLMNVFLFEEMRHQLLVGQIRYFLARATTKMMKLKQPTSDTSEHDKWQEEINRLHLSIALSSAGANETTRWNEKDAAVEAQITRFNVSVTFYSRRAMVGQHNWRITHSNRMKSVIVNVAKQRLVIWSVDRRLFSYFLCWRIASRC